MPTVLSSALLILLVVASRPASGRVAASAREAHQFLSAQFQLRDGDFRQLDRGQPITRTLDTVDGREVATLGAIRINVPPGFYVDQMRNIVEFKEGDAVLQIGAFSSPAHVDDVATLSLEPSDVEDLRRCRSRDCRLQLSAAALNRFRQQLPWHTASATAVNHTMRHVLVDLVNAYRNAGDAALMTYVDGDRPLSLADEFRSMVASRPAMLQRFPELHHHLIEYPRATTSGIEDIVYWSKEKMGPAVIVSVTHLSIGRISSAPPGTFAAASKQIYGSRYFDTSLGITVLLEAGRADALYLVYVNRSRLDALTGFWGGVKRALLRSRTRATMGSTLVDTRRLVEQRFRERRADIQ